MPSTESWGKDDLDPSDPEFTAKVRALMGASMLHPGNTAIVSPENAVRTNTWPWRKGELLGISLAKENSPLMQQMDKLAGLLTTMTALKQGAAYGFNDKQGKVNPQVWAHEFRHLASNIPGDPAGERVQAIMSAAYSNSRKQWEYNLRHYIGLTKSKDLPKDIVLENLDRDIKGLFGEGATKLPYNIFFSPKKGMIIEDNK